jgi:hypothetical protein
LLKYFDVFFVSHDDFLPVADYRETLIAVTAVSCADALLQQLRRLLS